MKKKTILAMGLIVAMLFTAGCGKASTMTDSTDDVQFYSREYYGYTDGATASEEAPVSTNAKNDAATSTYSSTEQAAEYDSASTTKAENDTATTDVITCGTEGVEKTSNKIITTYSYSIMTAEFDKTNSKLKESVKKYGGYFEDMNFYTDDTKRGSFTIRIPSANVEAFLNDANELGNVVSETEDATDITSEYVDTEARIRSLEAQHERLLTLMTQADSLETIIALEDRLTDVEYELDSYKSQLASYDNHVNYSTIYMDLQEMKDTQVVKEDSVGQRIVKGFSKNLSAVGNGLLNFLVFIITSLPYIVVIGIITVVGILITKKSKKRIAKKRESKKED